MRNKDITYWNVPVSKTLDKALEMAVESGRYSTKCDLIRDATRRLLEKIDSENDSIGLAKEIANPK